jgi:hypothetical protein
MAYATVEELAAALRIRVNADNTAALQACLDAAAVEIDHEIDAAPTVDEQSTALVVSAPWVFATTNTMADPGPGNFRTNATSPANVNALAVSAEDADGVSHPLTLAVGDTVAIVGQGQKAFLDVTGAPVSHGTWYEVPVDFLGGAMALTAGLVYELATLSDAPPVPTIANPLANRVNVLRGVEWYKANDAAFGVIGFDQSGVLTSPRDGFNRHAYTLTPLKEQWGIA